MAIEFKICSNGFQKTVIFVEPKGIWWEQKIYFCMVWSTLCFANLIESFIKLAPRENFAATHWAVLSIGFYFKNKYLQKMK